MVSPPGGDRRGEDRPQRLRLDALNARAECGDRRARSSFILPTETSRSRPCRHGTPDVGMALGIAREQRQLADEILHVVKDEGEAAVEFLEPLRIGQRLLAVRLGERARRLSSRGREAGRNLPSRAPPVYRARRGRRCRSAAAWWISGMRPTCVRSSIIAAGTWTDACPRTCPAKPQRLRARGCGRFSSARPEFARVLQPFGGGLPPGPVPGRGDGTDRTLSATSRARRGQSTMSTKP